MDTLKIRSAGDGQATDIEIDGRPIGASAVTWSCRAGELAHATIEIDQAFADLETDCFIDSDTRHHVAQLIRQATTTGADATDAARTLARRLGLDLAVAVDTSIARGFESSFASVRDTVGVPESSEVVHSVLDLGEDGEAWAIAGHVDDETALRSVVVHLWELDVLEDTIGTARLRTGTTSVRHRTGRWMPNDDVHDPEGDSRWVDDVDGEPWTFITT